MLSLTLGLSSIATLRELYSQQNLRSIFAVSHPRGPALNPILSAVCLWTESGLSRYIHGVLQNQLIPWRFTKKIDTLILFVDRVRFKSILSRRSVKTKYQLISSALADLIN